MNNLKPQRATDIVQRLREAREFELRDYEPTMLLYKDAADEIERLRWAMKKYGPHPEETH